MLRSSGLPKKLSIGLCLWLVLLLVGACSPRLSLPTESTDLQPSRESGSEVQPTLYWWRDGGIAGFCDGLAIWDSDLVAVTTCELGDLDRQSASPMPKAQQQQLESWVEQYSSFDWEQSDPPEVSDRLRITLEFRGQGSKVASASEKAAILTFATELFVLMSRSS